MDEVAADPVVEELSLEEAGRRHVDRLELLGRKRSTLMDYRSTLRVHLVPFFGDVPIAAITAGQIERYLTVKLRAGRAPKSIRNDLGLLFGVLGLAEKRGWVASNPCKHVELPRAGTHDDGRGSPRSAPARTPRGFGRTSEGVRRRRPLLVAFCVGILGGLMSDSRMIRSRVMCTAALGPAAGDRCAR